MFQARRFDLTLAVVAVLTLCHATACQGDPPGGFLLISVDAEPFAGLELIRVEVDRAEVVHRRRRNAPSTEERILLSDEDALFTWSLSVDGPQLATASPYVVPVGFVMQVRFVTLDVRAVFVDGTEVELEIEVPSGEQTGLKVVPVDDEPFPIEREKVTVINILFDPDDALVFNPIMNIMKPTIPAEQIDIEDLRVTRLVAHRAEVIFRDSALETEINQALANVGASIVVTGPVLARHMIVEDTTRTPAALVEALRLEPAVELATVIVDAVAAREPNDPKFDNQQNLPQILAPGAWDTVTGTSAVVVAVLDTGVDLTHPDIRSRIWVNTRELPTIQNIIDPGPDGVVTTGDFDRLVNSGLCSPGLTGDPTRCDCTDLVIEYADGVNDDDLPVCDLSMAPPPGTSTAGNCLVDDICGWDFCGVKGGPAMGDPTAADFDGHGTLVTGIVGAQGNNGMDVAGVMWNVAIIPIRISRSKFDFCTSPLHFGLELAAAYEVDIVSLSYQVFMVDDEICDPLVDADCFRDVSGRIAEGEAILEKLNAILPVDEVLFVVGAGNDAADLNDPNMTSIPSSFNPQDIVILSVGAVNANDIKTSYTNFGDSVVDIVAPGNRILGLSIGGGTRRAWSGTSFSTPQVAGAAGLLLSLDPTLSPQELFDLLTTTADPLPDFADRFANGRLNISAAVGAVP